MASRDQETLAAEYPVIYQELLKKRALQKGVFSSYEVRNGS